MPDDTDAMVDELRGAGTFRTPAPPRDAEAGGKLAAWLYIVGAVAITAAAFSFSISDSRHARSYALRR